MDQIDLFCGVSLNPQLKKQIQSLPQYALNQLMSVDSGYLQKVDFPNGTYLGKWIGSSCAYEEIEDIQENIHSIIKRFLNENYHPDKNPLYLLPGQNLS